MWFAWEKTAPEGGCLCAKKLRKDQWKSIKSASSAFQWNSVGAHDSTDVL